MRAFNHGEIEQAARSLWETRKTLDAIRKRNKGGAPFAFVDGPPYTNGKIHLGHAWNKVLKDMVLRVKRMQEYAVADRAGYDMHGLPIEGATMKQLGLTSNADIEKYGVDKFVTACRDLALRYREGMDEDFQKLGVWMDFANAYQPITPEYIDGVWMLVKRAHEKDRLYEGLRTMAWDPVYETACAKHELVYRTVTDQSIYVKLRVLEKEKPTNKFLLVWTTTPWTIPLNLAVMANPEIEYVTVRVGEEEWILAKSLAEQVLTDVAHVEYEVLSECTGEDLAGTRYEAPFADVIDYEAMRKDAPNMHTVVLTREYVDDSSGTGLVHSAPGCGPEDYEVGIQYGLPAFNIVEPDGRFPAPFEGVRARVDDKKFIELLETRGVIVAKQAYEHEYPHSERSKAPIIYRATKQWFFRVSDMREKLLEANNNVQWQPLAAYNAFSSWLENLRDNSITKQRYWGTPVPIWRNAETGELVVIGSIAELEERSGQTIEDPHKPWIDDITIPSEKKKGAVLTRIPDVLDVWIDAGTASWNTLGYPRDETTIDTHYPADFILEGKDQIRGWFNLLNIAGFLAFDEPAFKAVYMHGFINDVSGAKMSKSLGNITTPQALTEKYGTDAFRLYVTGAAAPAMDLNFTVEDLEVAQKNLLVLWNTVQYLEDLCVSGDITPREIDSGDEEERYMLSRAERVTLECSRAIEEFNLPLIPRIIEGLWLELSRTYIQLTREKAAGDDKQLVADLLYTVLTRILVLLAPVAPFITEVLYQQLGELVGRDESVHEQRWPSARTSLIDEPLEEDFNQLQAIITAGLAAREKIKQGVRWPLARALVRIDEGLARYDRLITRHLNVRNVEWNPPEVRESLSVEPNFGELAKSFGKDTQRVAQLIRELQPDPPVDLEGFAIRSEHVKRKTKPLDGFAHAEFPGGTIYIDEAVTDELLEDGFGRELTRRVQALRRDEGLAKRDAIALCITGDALSDGARAELARKTNATLVEEHFENAREEQIRDRNYQISCQKTI